MKQRLKGKPRDLTAGKRILKAQEERDDSFFEDYPEFAKLRGQKMWEDVCETAKEAKDLDVYRGKDFYLVLIDRVNKTFDEAEHLVFARLSCPTPVYTQSVWKYHHIGGNLEYIWTIPSEVRYKHILAFPNLYHNNPRYRSIPKMVMLMENGKLLDWVKKENGDKIENVVLKIKGDENV